MKILLEDLKNKKISNALSYKAINQEKIYQSR